MVIVLGLNLAGDWLRDRLDPRRAISEMAALLELEYLTVCFARGREVAGVESGVSFTVEQGETLGIVGECGCGKSVQVLAMLGLVPARPDDV